MFLGNEPILAFNLVFISNLRVRDQMGVNMPKHKPPVFIQSNQLIKIPVKGGTTKWKSSSLKVKETVKFHPSVSFLNTSCENL